MHCRFPYWGGRQSLFPPITFEVFEVFVVNKNGASYVVMPITCIPAVT